MLVDLYSEDRDKAARDLIRNPLPTPPRTASKFSAWSAATAVPRGVVSAAAEVLATGTELAYAPVQRRGLESADGAMSNDVADSLRAAGRAYAPDAETAHWSEQLLYGFARGASKIFGGAVAAGPLGVVAAGLEEANTQADALKQQGVDFRTRAGAGLVQGAGLAVAALPLVGPSLKATAALYVAGGPGGFMAQQALTREILNGAGYEKIGAQYDPFDPMGLAVSTLMPLPFVAYGLRGQRMRAELDKATGSIKPFDLSAPPTEPVPGMAPGTARTVPAPEVFPGVLTPTAVAARTYSPEVIDAAMVRNLVDRIEQNRTDPTDPALTRAEEANIARVEDAIQDGRVPDVETAPVRAPQTDLENSRAEPTFRGLTEDQYITQISEGGTPRVFAEPMPATAFAEVPTNGEAISSGSTKDDRPVQFVAGEGPAVIAVVDGRAVGYMAPESGTTGLFVADEFRGQGIGESLSTIYRQRDPFAPSGGFTAGGEAIARKVFRKLAAQEKSAATATSLTDPIEARVTAASQAVTRTLEDAGVSPDALRVLTGAPAKAPKPPETVAEREGYIASLPEAEAAKLRALYAQAEAEKPAFDATIEGIAAELGGVAKTADLKGGKRATAKITSDYNGDAGKIKDLLRATIEIASADDARRAVAAIFERFAVLPTGRRNLLTGDTPIDGYRDAKFNVLVNGHVAEVQINVPQMLAAKKNGGHKLYEEREALGRQIADMNLADIPPSTLARIGELNDRMRVLYDAAWADATSARNAASSIGAPLRLAESGGNTRGADVSQAAEYGASGTAPSDTGMPSTSKNSALGANEAGSETGFIGTSESIILQNRDRSTPGAIAQMQGIARSPDYTRLGFSRDFANGAPVVAGGSIPAAQLGRKDITAAGDTRIPVQYAVMEARDVLTSNDVSGNANPAYSTATDQTRAIAGNGRVAGLQAAYRNGTAADYRGELTADGLHGVDPAVIAAMDEPVLVRVMPESAITANIGDLSNQRGTLDLSATEQAKNDARRVDLNALEFSDDGSVTPQAVRRFVQAMPQAEQQSLIDTDGSPTRQAYDRLNAAIFSTAYESDALVRLYAQATDPEARNIMSALAQVAPSVARLSGAGALDIRGILTDAAEQAVNAKRRGIKLSDMAKQADLDTDPSVQHILRLFAANTRTVKPVVEALRRAADFAYAEATKDGFDMFGAVTRASRDDVLDQIGPGNERRIPQDVAEQAGGIPVRQDAVGQAPDQARPADSGQAEAGRAAEDFALTAPTPEQLRADADRAAAFDRADAAEQQRLADQARADAAAPEFTLTGSNRAADANADQGGLFDTRVADLNPSMVVGLDADGAPVTLADEIAAVRLEAQRGTPDLLGADDASLLEAAVLCALAQ